MNFDLNDFNDDFLLADGQLLDPFGLQFFNNRPILVDGQLARAKDGTIEFHFSTLKNLFNLVSNATPEMSKFAGQLEKIEETEDMKHLDSEIIYILYRSLRALLKRNLVISVVHSLFKKKFSNIAEFYCRVLSVYMLNISLPKNLNKCLRSGYLSQSDCYILPYLICLCKAFFCQTLNLNRMDDNLEPKAIELYQVIEADEEGLYNSKRIGEKIAMKEFGFFQTLKPLTGERRGRICLHIEISAEVTKNLKHSVYLELSPNRILFVRESDRAILAPGCEFIVSEILFDEELEATTIKLRIACQTEPQIGLRVETENHARSEDSVERTNNLNFWNADNDQVNYNLFEDVV